MTDALKCGFGISSFGCGRELRWGNALDQEPDCAIRCLDCRIVLCPGCAKRHFEESVAVENRVRVNEQTETKPHPFDEKWPRHGLLTDLEALNGHR